MENNTTRVPKLQFPEFRGSAGWEEKTLGDILKFQTGFPFESSGFNDQNKGIRLIRNRDLKSDDSIIFYSKPFDEKFLVNDGDILVGMDGDFQPRLWSSGEALLNQRVGRILNKEGNYHSFLLYLLSIHLKRLEDVTARTTVKHLSHSNVEKMQELVPTLPEQQKIADCLSSLDDLIHAESAKFEALQVHKKGLMQQLFPAGGETVPQLRFSEFGESGDWEEKMLINLAKNGFSNGVFNDPKKVGVGYKLINVKDMYIDTTVDESRLTLIDITEKEFSKNKVENGDIFFTRSSLAPAGIAQSNIYLGNSNEITFDGHLIRLRPDRETVQPLFLHYAIKTTDVRSQLVAKGKVATMTTIGQSDVATVELVIPTLPEQQKIADCLSSLDALLLAQAERIAALKVHKRGLMQQLFPQG